MRILVVESNPAETRAAVRESRGESLGENYARVLSQLQPSVTVDIIAPYDSPAEADLAGFSGVAFTGSSVEWCTEDERAGPLAAVMRQALGSGLPVFGSCNGMQLAATVLGGYCGASPNGREDGLARDIRLTEAGRTHPMMAGRSDGFAVPCMHRDEVQRLPEGAVLLAGNAHSPVQAFAYERDGARFWGCQYHPEFELENLAGHLERRGALPPDVCADMAAAHADAEAAARLGTSPGELAAPVRTLELRNWLRSL